MTTDVMTSRNDRFDSEKAESENRTATGTKLKFRALTLADVPLVNSMLQCATSRTCDNTIGGIFMWVKWFRYEYCVYANTLFIKGASEINPAVTAFSLPVGALPLEESVGLVREWCAENGITPVFSVVPEDRVDYLLSLFPGGSIEELPDWTDYLYDAEDLATLRGKKLNKKRNHVNRFMAENPHYVLEPLTHELLPETLLFCSGRRRRDGEEGPMADYELDQCIGVLNDWNTYPFEGVVLRGEAGDIVAFSVCEVIGDTAYVHIEKADHSVAGAGETINKLFAAEIRMRHPGVRFLNREEDVGDPGLRYAKESYHPAMLLKKYNVCF